MNRSPDVFYIQYCALSDARVPFYYHEGLGITFDPEVVTELARRLQLSFLPEESLNTDMCFLHSPELRPEFRLSLNLRDFTDFLHGVLGEQGQLRGSVDLSSKTFSIPYPEDPDEFWSLVELGALNR
jgi:hypothetical protein